MAMESQTTYQSRTFTPDRFYFRTQALETGEYSEVTYSRGALLFCAGAVFRQSPDRQFQCTADAFAWNRFWQRVEQIGVWNWKSDYRDPNVQNGLKWELEIRYGPRALKTGGQNRYPGNEGPRLKSESEFGQFLAAVHALAGVSEFIW